MTASFGETAQRLAGLATRLFGWTPDEFWAATPAELAAILATDTEQSLAPVSRAELDALMEGDSHGR